MSEFDSLAYKFNETHLKFLDRNWRYDVLNKLLSELLAQTVKEHTSAESNTVLRQAVRDGICLSLLALTHLPSTAQRCRCSELDDGEHKPQPLCHLCCLRKLQVVFQEALKPSDGAKT
jgi:hypothetical protein